MASKTGEQDLENIKDQGPVHQNCYERKGRRIANRTIIHLNGLFAASRSSIPWLNSIIEIPETNLRRWRKVTERDGI
jgi:hypothetical protein